YAASRYKAPETWLKKVEKNGHAFEVLQKLSPTEKLQEFTLMNLRLTQGLSLNRLKKETGLEKEEAYHDKDLKLLEDEGLLTITATHLIPTFEGRLRLNGLISFILKKSVEQGLES
ncbi:MAG: coproporphyrinogen III oxidase, partial [Alphaproteobacteria bacterium]|nr:coproporphyrinogen III oxidase [Alphaproteobacteria bacterium]